MIRRLLLLDHPQETRFFLFVGGFGIVLGAIYWILSLELAGTTLLLGFGLGAALLGVGLFRSRPRAVAVRARARRGATGQEGDDVAGLPRGADPDLPGGGTAGVDTPFDDPSGRLPGETLAPLSLGLGIALGLTSVVFGPWLLVAGLLPMGWGAWTWLTGARDELDATVEDETRIGPAGAAPGGPASRDTPDSGAAPSPAHPAHPEP